MVGVVSGVLGRAFDTNAFNVGSHGGAVMEEDLIDAEGKCITDC